MDIFNGHFTEAQKTLHIRANERKTVVVFVKKKSSRLYSEPSSICTGPTDSGALREHRPTTPTKRVHTSRFHIAKSKQTAGAPPSGDYFLHSIDIFLDALPCPGW